MEDIGVSKKYTSLAKEIVESLGGKANINDAYHCQTRLRFKLADENMVDDDKVGSIDGVVKVVRNAGVYQVVIGTHVADVFEEIEKFVDVKKEAGSQEAEEKKNIAETIIDFVAGVFQPVIPALSGAGMVKALLALLVVLNVITPENQTYALLNLFADGVFYFLPLILAFTTAQKLKCNPILAAGVGAMMLHPNWIAMVEAGKAVKFFDVIPFTLTTYGSSVIPIILVIFVQSYVEKFLKRVIPKAVELVFLPMLTFLIMGVLAFAVLGPIGSILGGYLATFFTFLSETAAWAPAVLVGGFLPLMVMFGLHNGVAPLGVMQMANLGYDSIFGPGCVCSNIAQSVASLVVAVRTKNTKDRSLALSSGITAMMGITEPALYGVNLPKKYPLVAAMIGGGCGGLFAGLTHTHRFATGSSGIPAVLLYIGDNTMQYLYNIIIALVITVVVTAIVTWVLSIRYEKTDDVEVEDTDIKKIEVESKELGDICAPVDGMLIEQKEIADETFASGILGKGIGIEPEEGHVYAPFSGIIGAVADSGHAIGITDQNGDEILIHVGIDTVAMQGKGFSPKVKQGDKVEAGDEILVFDQKMIKEAGYKDTVIVILTNLDETVDINMKQPGKVKAGEKIIGVKQS